MGPSLSSVGLSSIGTRVTSETETNSAERWRAPALYTETICGVRLKMWHLAIEAADADVNVCRN